MAEQGNLIGRTYITRWPVGEVRYRTRHAGLKCCSWHMPLQAFVMIDGWCFSPGFAICCLHQLHARQSHLTCAVSLISLFHCHPGVLLNNDMDDFSTAQQANTYHLEPSTANFIRPGKKPLSSMSPTMLMDSSGNLRMVVGASGGPRIVTAVLQAIVRQGQAPCLHLLRPGCPK